MDYRDSVEAADFRRSFRQWLAVNHPSEATPLGGEERAEFLGQWHRVLYEGGWMGLSWPADYGGRNLPPVYEAIFNDEIGRAGAPAAPHVGFLGRALLHFGTEEQKTRFLPSLLSGEETWCQGFSEPGAGSDLASLSSRAILTDGHYVVNGQKIWTSDAAWADWCLLLVRSEPGASGHQGLSMLLVDMSLGGIEVRPIVQINGDREFNEVFFTDVAVGAERLLGRPGQGWTIAMTTVAYERGPTDVGFSSRYRRVLGELLQVAATGELAPAQRLALARAHVQVEVLRVHVLRSLAARADGAVPGPEGSLDKLLSTETEQLLHHVAMDLHGAAALVGGAPGVLVDYLYSRAASIAGGTTQIQRSIVAERLLGLPRSR